jgi:hypothetical protein
MKRVQDHHIWAGLSFAGLNAFRAGEDRLDLEVLATQQRAQHGGQVRVVVDEQYFDGHLGLPDVVHIIHDEACPLTLHLPSNSTGLHLPISGTKAKIPAGL